MQGFIQTPLLVHLVDVLLIHAPTLVPGHQRRIARKHVQQHKHDQGNNQDRRDELQQSAQRISYHGLRLA